VFWEQVGTERRVSTGNSPVLLSVGINSGESLGMGVRWEKEGSGEMEQACVGKQVISVFLVYSWLCFVSSF
jgi:hypothetical protein